MYERASLSTGNKERITSAHEFCADMENLTDSY